MSQYWRSLLSLAGLTIVCGLVVLWCVPGIAQQVSEPKTKAPEQKYANDPYWQHARQEVYKSVLVLMAQRQDELAKNLKYHILLQGNPRKKLIALTFDDGPHPQSTPRLLEILAQEKVKATFFVIGEMAEQYPDLVRAELAAGHAVGNHTYHHVNLTKILEGDVATEIDACTEALNRITGVTPHLFRPPGGDYDTGVAEASEALAYTMVLWTDDPGDYASPGAQVIQQRIIRKAGNGGIILIHDGVDQTIQILPQMIKELKVKGYTFVTVDELMKPK